MAEALPAPAILSRGLCDSSDGVPGTPWWHAPASDDVSDLTDCTGREADFDGSLAALFAAVMDITVRCPSSVGSLLREFGAFLGIHMWMEKCFLLSSSQGSWHHKGKVISSTAGNVSCRPGLLGS